MRVIRLSCRGFRNLQEGEFHAHEGINVIYGENAQGKTNLLEAIWMFSGAKSFRGAKDSELIRYETPSAALSLAFFSAGRDQEAKIKVEGRRTAELNGVPLRAASELAGKIKAVVFSPSHLSLVKDGPAERRRFLDTAIAQIKPGYLAALMRYSRAVSQRNALLKDLRFHAELFDMLEAFEDEIAETGSVLLRHRIDYVGRLSAYAPEIYAGLSGGRERFVIGYQSGAEEGGIRTARELKEGLIAARKEDIAAGSTSVGPHRDDLKILIDGMPARNFGSQGQQRSAVLALKLGEAAVLREISEEQPIALLDDVMSELDPSRQDYILNHIEGWQVFLTCCEKETIGPIENGRAYRMRDGAIIPD